MGYIINVSAPKTVRFSGRAWQDTTSAVAAPKQPLIPKAWAFVLRAHLEGISGMKLVVYNGHTRVAEAVERNNYHAAWVDMNRETVVSVGDTLRIEVRDTTGALIRTFQHKTSAVDVHRAFTEFRLTSADLIPKRTVLLANYPNPFNPETWIPYHLANASDVQITIFDTRGSIVRTLMLGHRAAGYYTGRNRAAYWDGRNNVGERTASGVYFYRLQADTVSLLRKMVILK